MAEIIIDNKKYEVAEGKHLLETCLNLGFDLPYFCWHPALDSVGACRQCAIKQYKDEKDEKGKIFMACMQPVKDGVRISLEDPEVKQFRAQIIEGLMVNHPHDCPTCDEGGECHLQDMTVMTGHTYRRYRFKKRSYRNQYLGPFINHEMNRCIQCYRCVRFYKDYAGGRDLDAYAANNRVYFGRYEDGVLQNEFSGNLVEVCPTGVFTDKTLKQHYTRKWDLTAAPSICHHCSLGCNTIAGERYGSLRRILSRYNGEVNGYFICDRGRFGYEFVNSEKRVRQPLQRKGGALEVITKEALLRETHQLLSTGKVIGIGSPRASLESNFALRKLVGEAHFYAGISKKESGLTKKALDILKHGPARSPSLKETEKADAVLVLGEDLTNTAPMLALALRQSVRQQPMEIPKSIGVPLWNDAAVREAIQDTTGPLFIASVSATKLDDVATHTFHTTPDNIARLGMAVAHVLDNNAPVVEELSERDQQLAQKIATSLKAAKNPLIVSGTSLGSMALLEAAANVAWALCTDEKQASLSFTFPECNSLGLGMMTAQHISHAIEALEKGDAETVVILENDLYRRIDQKMANRFFDLGKKMIVLDHIQTDTTDRADIVIPSGTFAESDGTLINNEGRGQRFFQVQAAGEATQESWRWLSELMASAGRKEEKFDIFDDFTHALAREMPQFEGIQHITPPADFRIAGKKIAREPHRYSGRTAMFANHNVSEPKPPEDPDTPMSFTMEGYQERPPSSTIPYFWSPGWNSAQAINKYQIEVGGSLHGGDPGKRLIEPDKNTQSSFFSEVPKHSRQQWGAWTVVPIYHIFGSEEMSMLAPAVAERAPSPSLYLNPEDASDLQVSEAEEVSLDFSGTTYQWPVTINHHLSRGVVGYPAGLPGVPVLALPHAGNIKKSDHE